jgi:PAS domain S-box-containing protein
MADGRFIDVNEAWTRLFGWTRAQVVGRNSFDLGIWPNPEDRQAWISAMQRPARPESYETKLRDKSGHILSILFSTEMVELGGEPCLLALSIDLTEQKKAEAALVENEKRLREAQRIGNFGSWELDLASNMFTWSDEITHIFEAEASSGTVEYATFLGTVHRDDRASFDKAYRQLVAEGGSGEFSYRLPMPDGRIKVAHVRAEAKVGQDGRPIKLVGTTQDITEQVLAREEIQRLNAGLEQRVQERTAELTAANRELESFAYSISHDLRAPLRGIDGFSHLLAEEYAERLDETGRGYLERVRRAAQRMGELIDDILELSRVTRQDMRRVTVDLSRIAAEVIEERARVESDRKAEITIAPGCTAQGDPQLLRVLMQNLLENAWKYSRRAEPARIAFGQETRDGETVFFVRDNGVGFDMQYAERLFAPFQRLHRPEEFEGSGIGLATVARVTHRHGGRVWAEAETGKGATFRFTLG